MSHPITSINPLKVAEKLDAARNFQLPAVLEEIENEPRLVEALWFLCWVSLSENYAGGLSKFAADFVEKYKGEVGPESLLVLAGKSALSTGEVESVTREMSAEVLDQLLSNTFSEAYTHVIDANGMEEEETMKQIEAKRARAIRGMTFATMHQACIEFAEKELPLFLVQAASDPECPFSGVKDNSALRAEHYYARLYLPESENALWYFPRFWKCLFQFMDDHASAAAVSFAETSVTREIFHWLSLAQETGKGVMFLGNSRFGKSRAIRAYAQMHPGKVRLVECPASGSESDLLRELCRALGIRFTSITPPLHEQRAAIEKVLRCARFLVILDEAQLLYPSSGSRRVAPKRLDYVRRSIMDAGIPTAFICTHQSWKHVEQGFLKFSSYSNEQFEGRLLRSPIHLPTTLTEDEMIAVARIHLPELDTDYLKMIVTPIRLCKGDHLSYIENIALISRRYASQRGLSVPRLADIEKARNDVLPCFTAPQEADASDSGETATKESAQKRRRTNRPAATGVTEFRGPRRSTSPAGFSARTADSSNSADLSDSPDLLDSPDLVIA